VDNGFAASVDVPVEDDVLNLAITEQNFDAVEFDIVPADDELQPLELTVLTANVDHVVIVDKADMPVAQPNPLVAADHGGGFFFLPPQLGDGFTAEIGS